MSLSSLLPIGRFQVIRRLQTAGAQFAALLDLQSFRLQAEMLGKHPRQDVISGLLAISRFQFRQQAPHRLADALQVSRQLGFLKPIDILPGVPLQIRSEKLAIALLIFF